MDNFAFIIHPIDARQDVARKFPALGLLPAAFIDFLSLYIPPLYISHITGIQSLTGKIIEGWFLACPMTARRMMTVPVEVAYRKIAKTGELARNRGARIIGLGAFTSVVGDAGVTVARHLNLPTTTGNTYTVAATVRAIFDAAEKSGLQLDRSTAAVVGATGSIGSACARILAPRVAELILVGRTEERVAEIRGELLASGAGHVVGTCAMDALRNARLVIAASSARKPIIDSGHLSPGVIVCDVSRPFNVSEAVRFGRPDVQVINGGTIGVPGPVQFGFDFGMPPATAFACMAETMILALEGRYENYSLGRNISLEKVEEIDRLAEKHGFYVFNTSERKHPR
jgi:fatty aldehyde-generating acyl-ACP reductase